MARTLSLLFICIILIVELLKQMETYHIKKEMIYVKHVSNSDKDVEYPKEILLSLHSDDSDDGFCKLLLERYLDSLDHDSSKEEESLLNENLQSKNLKRQHIYKVNNEPSFVTLKRLSEQSFHLQGTFCLDGKLFTIEPTQESNGIYQKHLYSSTDYDSEECIRERNNVMDSDTDINIPKSMTLSNAFGKHTRKESAVKERVKRQIEQLTIELLMVIDYAAYNWWQTMIERPGDVESQVMALIKQYYGYVFQGIYTRFQSIENQPYIINLAFSGLLVAKTKEESYWTTTSILDGDGESARVMVNSSEALEKFQKWLDDTESLPKYDHAILFTGTNLTYAGSPGNTGLAFASSMCQNISNSSIVEDIFDYRTITYATQQVARALGTRDDMDNNDCLEFFNYLMSPKFKLPIKSFPSNKWKFSTCSEQYIKEYNAELNEDGLTCLKETSLAEKYPEELAALIQELPGVTYSGRKQCENAFGLNSDVCRIEIGASYSEICSGLLCTLPDSSGKCGLILPADGTPCGNRKYCWQGSCSKHENAPESSDTCAFGNDPNMECYNLVVSEPSQCYLEEIKFKCCKTCELFYTGITGCEYGDRSDDCTRKDCVDGDQDYASKTCCFTCLDGPTPFPMPILSTTGETISATSTSLQIQTSPIVTSTSSNFPSTTFSQFDTTKTSTSSQTSSTPFSSSKFLSSSQASMRSFLSSEPPSVEYGKQEGPKEKPSDLDYLTDLPTTEGQEFSVTDADIVSMPLSYPKQGVTIASPSGNTRQNTDLNDILTTFIHKTSTVGKTQDVDRSKTPTERVNEMVSVSQTSPYPASDTMSPNFASKITTSSYITEKLIQLETNENTLLNETYEHSSSTKRVNSGSGVCVCQVDSVSTTSVPSTKHPITEPSVTSKCVSVETKGSNRSFYNKIFFKDVARSMQRNQRRINDGVYYNVKALYTSISDQLRGFQREYENENESWREGSETPSNDDDDVNKKLKPIWRKHYHYLIRDLKRDVREMRYRVLALMNRHFKEQM